MKHQVPESMKFKKLMRLLNASKPLTAGLLELLWVATQKNAPRGDIGKFDNLSIAIECGWEGDADELVSALIETGWLDEDAEFRLIVHDWKDHAPYYIKGVVAKQGGFACPSLKSATIVDDYSRGRNDASVDDNSQEQRNLTKPNLTKPNVTFNQRGSKNSTDAKSQYGEQFELWWKMYPNKQGKAEAQKKFRKMTDDQIDDLFTATRHYKQAIEHGVNSGLACHGSTFINGRYLDWVESPSDELMQVSIPIEAEKPQAGDKLRRQLEEQENPFAGLFGNNHQPQTIESPQNVKRLN